VDSSKAFGSEYYRMADEAISQLLLDDELATKEQVAEMGDRLATIDIDRKEGDTVHL